MWGFGIVVWWKGSGVFSSSEDQGCAHRIWRGEFPSNGYLRVNPSIASQGLLTIKGYSAVHSLIVLPAMVSILICRPLIPALLIAPAVGAYASADVAVLEEKTSFVCFQDMGTAEQLVDLFTVQGPPGA